MASSRRSLSPRHRAGAPEVRVEIVYRDEHLLVLDKPPRLPTTSPDGGDCLARRARELDPEAPKMHASSRLDRDVTGLVTFARTERAIRALLEARRSGRYRRLYLALVCGAPAQRGSWEWPIAIDERDVRLRTALDSAQSVSESRRPQLAKTGYHNVAQCTVDPSVTVSALRLIPRTGRTHQLRVHASRAGTPILGDGPYRGIPRITLPDGRIVSARRCLLHCARLELPWIDPGARRSSSGSPSESLRVERGEHAQVFRSVPPRDLIDVWSALGGSPEALSTDIDLAYYDTESDAGLDDSADEAD